VKEREIGAPLWLKVDLAGTSDAPEKLEVDPFLCTGDMVSGSPAEGVFTEWMAIFWFLLWKIDMIDIS